MNKRFVAAGASVLAAIVPVAMPAEEESPASAAPVESAAAPVENATPVESAVLVESESEGVGAGFYGWRVSAGGFAGFGLKTKLRFAVPERVYSGPTSPAVGSPADIAAALAGGRRVSFLNGAYVDPSGNYEGTFTQNWRFPASSVDRTTGAVRLDSAQIDGAGMSGRGSDDKTAFGASVELARTLYAHEDGFGVDLAVGFSWMRRNNCFKGRSGGKYMDRSSYLYTPTPNGSNQAILTSPYIQPTDGYYGSGSAGGFAPVLDWSDLGPGTIEQISSTSSSYSLYAEGDYEEWNALLMAKPWWALTDWWLLTGTLGVGVSRSEFEIDVSGRFGDGGSYSSHRTTDKWDCYGVGGFGVMFRVWRLDLSCDVLARFCQNDIKVHSEAVSGRIEKPDVFVCCAVGFEF